MLSQRSTELSCTRFDEERSKKSKAIDEQRCGTVFFLREYISPRTNSTALQVQVVGVCEVLTLAGMPDSSSCWTRLALADEKEGER